MNLSDYKRQSVLYDFGVNIDDEYLHTIKYIDTLFDNIHPFTFANDFYSVYYGKSIDNLLFDYNATEDYINFYHSNIDTDYLKHIGFNLTEIDYILVTKAIEYLKLF